MEDSQLPSSRLDVSQDEPGSPPTQSQATDLSSGQGHSQRPGVQMSHTADRVSQAAAAPPTGMPTAAAVTQYPPGMERSPSGGPLPTSPLDTSQLISECRDASSDAGSSEEDVTYYNRAALLAMSRDRVVELCLLLQSRHRVLRQRVADPGSQTSGGGGGELQTELGQLSCRLQASQTEVVLTREALTALKSDRKRLKAEKFELLNQMKQMYQTLEDKEGELRDFIRNYEQRIQENSEAMRGLSQQRDALERERWSVLKRARQEGDRCVALAARLGDREAQLQSARSELSQLRRRLSQNEGCSDAEPSSQPGLTPCSGLSAANAPASGRGSSADSGVRVNSDRDSLAAGNLSDSTTSGEAPVGQRCSPLGSPLTVPDRSAAISRSAEHLASLEGLERWLRPRGAPKHTGTWGSISRVFSRQKQRKQLQLATTSGEAAWSAAVSPLTEALYAEKLGLLEAAQQLPMERWKASMVLAWLQVTLGMPQYGPACAENVRSGKVMLDLTDMDLERVLGIAQPLHRKKLRLAIEELRQPQLCRYPYISQLSHAWVASEWLPQLGLPQLAETFSAHLIDGRLLAHLTRRELEKQLGVTRRLHQVSLMRGIELLRQLQFDRQIISERRRRSGLSGGDLLVWSNARLVQWACAIDLAEYADNLKGSGVHGALVVLDSSFGADSLAAALGIPQSKTMLRRHLATELEKLMRPARLRLEEEESRGPRWEPGRDRPATLGRAFSRSYAGGLQGRADPASASLRGSLSRSVGARGQSADGPEPEYARPRQPARLAVSPQDRPQSAVTVGQPPERHHRRVKSIGDIESVTSAPPV